jgi:hypothetical protein
MPPGLRLASPRHPRVEGAEDVDGERGGSQKAGYAQDELGIGIFHCAYLRVGGGNFGSDPRAPATFPGKPGREGRTPR